MSIPTKLQPLPTYNQVRPHVILLTEYLELYGYYFFGKPLPPNYPESIIKQFPNRSYKRQLKAAIAREQNIVNQLEATQNEYLTDYYTLYMHYAYSTVLPADFPEAILKEFPSKNYKSQLKAAIAQLQGEIDNEKK